jgi:hypothetical protein
VLYLAHSALSGSKWWADPIVLGPAITVQKTPQAPPDCSRYVVMVLSLRGPLSSLRRDGELGEAAQVSPLISRLQTGTNRAQAPLESGVK